LNSNDFIIKTYKLDITDNSGNRLQTTCTKDEIDKVLEESILILSDIQREIIYNSSNSCIIGNSIVGKIILKGENKI